MAPKPKTLKTAAKKTNTKKTAAAPAHRVPPAKPKAPKASRSAPVSTPADRERFKQDFEAAEEGPIGNVSLLADIEHAEATVKSAILSVSMDASLAEVLSDSRSTIRFQTGKGEPLTLEYLVSLATKSEADIRDWPTLCDSDGRANVKRGTAPFRKVPAVDVEKWLRGDKTVVRPRLVNLDGEFVAQKDGAEYRIIPSVRHYFATNTYECFVTKATLAQIKGEDQNEAERLRIIDGKIHLKKEIKEYPGDKARGDHARKLLALMLATTPDDAEEGAGDTEGEDE